MIRIYGVAALVLALLAGIGVQTVRLSHSETELAVEKADRAEDVRRATQAALVQSESYRTLEQQLTKTKEDAEHVRIKDQAASAAVAAGLRAERDGVRRDLAAYAAGGGGAAAVDTVAACRDRAAALGDALAGSLRTEEDLTDQLERRDSDTRSLLDAWPRMSITAPHPSAAPP